ncbi:MAG: hypothetical protein LBI44_07320 [Oscillospiraceae bacterium]|nr:hypothetical protein [Oscillospiraceae bacterium]
MKGGRVIYISVGALLLAAVFVFFFAPPFRPGGDVAPLALPSPDVRPGEPMGVIPDPILSFAPREPLTPGPGSAQAIIATLSREDAYSADITVRWAWSGGEGVRYYTVYVRADGFRADEKDSAGKVLRSTLCIGDDLYYRIPPGIAVFEGRRGDASVDDFASIPTYEDLLLMPADVITNIGYDADGEYLVVYTADSVYLGQYIISVATGHLRQATFFEPESASYVYQMDMAYIRGEPPEEAFVIGSDY